MADQGETVQTTIGGRRYTIKHVPTTTGLQLGARLLNVLAPGIGGMTGDTQMSTALAQLLRSGNLGDQFEALCTGFAPYTEIEIQAAGKGTPALTKTLSACFDTHFAGKYDELIEWLLFVIQWDLSSFLAGAFAALKRASSAVEGMASKSTSPKPVDGTG